VAIRLGRQLADPARPPGKARVDGYRCREAHGCTILLRLGWGGEAGMVHFLASQAVDEDRCTGHLVIARNSDLAQPPQVLGDFEDMAMSSGAVVAYEHEFACGSRAGGAGGCSGAGLAGLVGGARAGDHRVGVAYSCGDLSLVVSDRGVRRA
jgi:hypothetical protein